MYSSNNEIISGVESNVVEARTSESTPSHAPLALHTGVHGPRALAIKWQPPPLAHMRGIIVGYRLHCSALNANLSSGGSSSSSVQLTTNASTRAIIIGNLLAEARYCVRVAAMTRVGLGPFTTPACVHMSTVNLTTSQPPPSPPAVETAAESVSHVLVVRAFVRRQPWLVSLVGTVALLVPLALLAAAFCLCQRRRQQRRFDATTTTTTTVKSKSRKSKRYQQHQSHNHTASYALAPSSSSASSSSSSSSAAVDPATIDRNRYQLVHTLNKASNGNKNANGMVSETLVWPFETPLYATSPSTGGGGGVECYVMQHPVAFMRQPMTGVQLSCSTMDRQAAAKRNHSFNSSSSRFLAAKLAAANMRAQPAPGSQSSANATYESATTNSTNAPQYVELQYNNGNGNGNKDDEADDMLGMSANPYATTGLFVAENEYNVCDLPATVNNNNNNNNNNNSSNNSKMRRAFDNEQLTNTILNALSTMEHQRHHQPQLSQSTTSQSNTPRMRLKQPMQTNSSQSPPPPPSVPPPPVQQYTNDNDPSNQQPASAIMMPALPLVPPPCLALLVAPDSYNTSQRLHHHHHHQHHQQHQQQHYPTSTLSYHHSAYHPFISHNHHHQAAAAAPQWSVYSTNGGPAGAAQTVLVGHLVNNNNQQQQHHVLLNSYTLERHSAAACRNNKRSATGDSGTAAVPCEYLLASSTPEPDQHQHNFDEAVPTSAADENAPSTTTTEMSATAPNVAAVSSQSSDSSCNSSVGNTETTTSTAGTESTQST